MSKTPDPALAAEIAARRKAESDAQAALDAAQKLMDPDDLNSERLDQMSRRLFNTLDHQLTAVEKAKNDSKDAAGRAADARTLASLQRTMEQLARTERERAAMRNSRASKKNAELRAAIDRKWAKIFEVEFTVSVPEESQ